MSIISQVQAKLAEVIDPGTSLDVMEMRLVKNLCVDEVTGKTTLTFAPSSSVCPMAFKLAADIKRAVDSVAGVTDVEMSVENYTRSRELEDALNAEG